MPDEVDVVAAPGFEALPDELPDEGEPAVEDPEPKAPLESPAVPLAPAAPLASEAVLAVAGVPIALLEVVAVVAEDNPLVADASVDPRLELLAPVLAAVPTAPEPDELAAPVAVAPIVLG